MKDFTAAADQAGKQATAGVPMGAYSLSPDELAERLGVSLQTVYGWNKTGDAPPRMRIGRHIRYRLADVVAWEESRLVGTTA